MYIQARASELLIFVGLISFGHNFELMQWQALFEPGNRLQERAKVLGQAVGRLRGIVTDPTGSIVPNYSSVEVRVAAPGNTAPYDKTAPPIMTQVTDRQGGFSFDLQLGSYEICVARFPKSCTVVEVRTESPPFLELKINPVEDPGSPELLDNRLQSIAGAEGENCGHVRIRESPKAATECALRAFKNHRAFYVRYDDVGVDSKGAEAMAGDSSGNIYHVEFDSMGVDSDNLRLRPGVTMPDGFHTVVRSCSKPVRLRRTRTGKLTCFSDGRWLAYDY